MGYWNSPSLVFIFIGSLLKAEISYFPYNPGTKEKRRGAAFLTDSYQTCSVCQQSWMWRRGKRRENRGCIISRRPQETYHQDICRSVCQCGNKKDVKVLLALAIHWLRPCPGMSRWRHKRYTSAEVRTVGREGCGLGKWRNKCCIFFSSGMTFRVSASSFTTPPSKILSVYDWCLLLKNSPPKDIPTLA